MRFLKPPSSEKETDRGIDHEYWPSRPVVGWFIEHTGHAWFDNQPLPQSPLYSPTNLGNITEDQLPPQWLEYLAAIHFNVSPDKALQVLIYEPIRSAIINKNSEKLKEISKVKGFVSVLEQVIHSDSVNWSKQDTNSLTNAAIVMKPGRGLTNVLVVYDTKFKAPASITEAWQHFQETTDQ